jgi:CubicO group peptidase (beta-lactamase class C family)
MTYREETMKRYVHHALRTISALTLLLALAVQARPLWQAASIAGHWEGAIQVPGAPINIQVDVKTTADGKLAATITIPAQGARDLPLANVSLNGAEFAFDLPNAPGEPKYRGRLSADGQKIEGTFTQLGQNFPCNLERKADPVALAKAALAGIEAVAADAMKKFDVPGMALAVVRGREIIFAKGLGYRDVEKQLPVTVDTLFAIGSSSKAFTTFTLGTLVDEGKLEWDRPVRAYIPWLKLYDPVTTERLSVRDLVTHRSGLPRHDLVWYNNYEATRESFVRKLAYLEPSADLRTRYQYNNLMFLTAGYLIEIVTGKTWEEAVRARVFTPLGMTRSNFSVRDSQKDNDFAQPYAKRDDKVVKLPFRDISNIGPAGSINSSVNEMARWVITHLNGGKYGEKKLAEAATVNELHLPQMATGAPSERPDISPGAYALGWLVDTYRGHQRVQHGGNIDGFSANVVLFPKDGVGIVALTNLNGTPLRDLIAREIADRLFKLEKVDWINSAAANRARAEAAAKEGEKKKEVARVAGTQPAHKLADYVGDYEHPGYGVLRVTLSDGKLEAKYNNIATPLEHWHYETFNGGKGGEVTFENMKYTFQTDAKGLVAKLAATFEPAVGEIVFARKPDARWFDPAYLARFAGEYDLLGQTITVSLLGNVLTAQAAGQPRSELVPGLDGGFTPKLSRAVSWYFVQDASGKVAALELRQPATVLTAKRKQ